MNGRYQESLRRQFLKSTLLSVLISFVLFALLLLAYSEGFNRYNLRKWSRQAQQQADSIYDFYADFLTDEAVQADICSFLSGEISDRLMTYSFRMRCNDEPARSDLLVLDADGQQVYYSGPSDVSALHPEYYRWMLSAIRPADRSILSRFYYFLGNATWMLNAVIFREDGTPAGQAFIILGEEALATVFRTSGYEVVLTDKGGLAAMSTNISLLDSRHRFSAGGKSRIAVDGATYLIQSEPLAQIDGSVSALVVRGSWRDYFLAYIVALAVMVGFMAVQSNRFSKWLALRSARSLQELHTELAAVRQDPDRRLSVDSDDEFGEISDRINRLLDTVSSLNQKSLALERSRNEMARAQIKAQFHPHFIYNTLESIRFAILMKDNDSASRMLLALTSLLRYSVEHNDYITLEEDMEHIREYLDIMRFRYGDRFNYSFDVADETRPYLIPPLFIQPLLENSLKYGFADRDSLELSVKTWVEDDALHIRIHDNGVGMEPQELALQRQLLADGQMADGHFGIGLVARSLKLQYGEDSSVTLDSTYGQGMTVELTLKRKVVNNGI